MGYEERKNVGDERHLGRYALIIFDIAKVLNYFEKDEELSSPEIPREKNFY